MKPLFILLTLLCATIALKAQVYPGITAGYQIASLKDSEGKSRGKESNGFRVGGFVDLPLFKQRFGLRLETSYSRISINDDQSADYLQLHYLSTPLSFFYTPNRQVQLFIGPQLNSLFRQKGPSVWIAPPVGKLDTFDFGIHGSIEMFFSYKWSVAFRYYQGLKYNNKYQIDLGNGMTDVSANRISSIQLGLNYIIRNDPELKEN